MQIRSFVILIISFLQIGDFVDQHLEDILDPFEVIFGCANTAVHTAEDADEVGKHFALIHKAGSLASWSAGAGFFSTVLRSMKLTFSTMTSVTNVRLPSWFSYVRV